ncbi:MAG: hypothetical protein WBC90_07565 [Albidovulum sp.]
MKKHVIAIAITCTVSGCVEPPKSPMEAQARLAVAAEFAAQNCGGFVGGYDGAKKMKEDANRSIVTAKNLGATAEVFAKAKTDVQTGFNTAAAFTTRQEACNALISQVAWSTN